jgi:Protein of unknown function (DUF2789)
MDLSNHTLEVLFAQLGLPNSASDIELFIAKHRPLPEHILLADASFWSSGQAQFLREEITEDAEWAEVVDQLDVMLRK